MKQVQGGLAQWQRRRVVELMEDVLDGDRYLADLAAACHLSARHFARAFAQSEGMPPHRWILRRRIEKAKELLAHSDLTLIQIALETSFATQSHFTRVFKQHVGVSPGAWRRERRS